MGIDVYQKTQHAKPQLVKNEHVPTLTIAVLTFNGR